MESVWNEGVTGGGVVVTIVDDGTYLLWLPTVCQCVCVCVCAGLETTHSELYRHYVSIPLHISHTTHIHSHILTHTCRIRWPAMIM